MEKVLNDKDWKEGVLLACVSAAHDMTKVDST